MFSLKKFLLTILLASLASTSGAERAQSRGVVQFSDGLFETNVSIPGLPLRIPEELRPYLMQLMLDKSSTRPKSSTSLDLSKWSTREARSGFFDRVERVPLEDVIEQPKVFTCGGMASDVFVNFVNPKYPDGDSTAGTCRFRLQIARPDVCQVRIDFVDTQFMPPRDGRCLEQFLNVGGSVYNTGFDRICGSNTDQHFYVHLTSSGDNGLNRFGDLDKGDDGDDERDGRFVDIVVSTIFSRMNYKFGLWLTQIDCSSSLQLWAPSGCTQFFLGTTGAIKSFNYEGDEALVDANYNVCVRSPSDACFFVLDADRKDHFDLTIYPTEHARGRRRGLSRRRRRRNRRERVERSGVGDSECRLDYLLLPGARGNASAKGSSNDRFCGGALNPESDKDDNVPLYVTTSGPVTWLKVVIPVRTDNVEDRLRELQRRPRRRFNLMSFMRRLRPRRTNDDDHGRRRRRLQRMRERLRRPFQRFRLGHRHDDDDDDDDMDKDLYDMLEAADDNDDDDHHDHEDGDEVRFVGNGFKLEYSHLRSCARIGAALFAHGTG